MKAGKSYRHFWQGKRGDPVEAAAALDSPEGPTEAAQVLNKQDLQKRGVKDYPLGLAALGRGGHVVALLHVRADGTVAETRLETASGYLAIDELTLRLQGTAAVVPAKRGGAASDSWQLIQWHWSAEEEPWNSFGKLNAMRPVH